MPLERGVTLDQIVVVSNKNKVRRLHSFSLIVSNNTDDEKPDIVLHVSSNTLTGDIMISTLKTYYVNKNKHSKPLY